MSRINLILLAVLAAFISRINAECANACNGHGKCVGYDMCICNRNWQANDCSERVCMHGLAHVDTPKGDLDMSGSVVRPGAAVVADNSFQYPYGTTEQFPQMEDTDLRPLSQSAHYYMECSNKGTCDRKTGLCDCFDGYDGVACQRASCPGFPASCSGHGVCKSVSQLAQADNGNVYKLWNKDVTMGCECDSGYFGPDCSERKCKVGIDPLYLDDSSTVKYSIFDFATLTTAATANFDDGHPTQGKGYWAIRFFDHSGEDWVTAPIEAGASCEAVMQALYGIPNEVVPVGSLECVKTSNNDEYDAGPSAGWNDGVDAGAGSNRYNARDYKINYEMAIWDAYIDAVDSSASQSGKGLLEKNSELGNNVMGPKLWVPGSKEGGNTFTRAKLSGHIYRVKFFGNPGKLREPEIITHLDGKRNSLMSTTFSDATSANHVRYAVITKVWTDGQQGEDVDYFADHCNGVSVTISTDDKVGNVANQINSASKYYRIAPQNAAQVALLKKCLGDSDATSTNNVEIYNWDYGSDDYPHLIKLVRSVTTSTDGGYYAALKFDGTYFNLMNPFVPPDALLTDTYEVYTTKGTLSRVSERAQAHFGFASNKVITTNTAKLSTAAGNAALWDGDLSCEVGANNGFRLTPSVYLKTLASETATANLVSNRAVNGDNVELFIKDVVTEWTYDYGLSPVQRQATASYKNCLNKTDIITFLTTGDETFNPRHINLYTIERLVQDKTAWSNAHRFAPADNVVSAPGSSAVAGGSVINRAEAMSFGTNVITLDLSTNWGTTLGEDGTTDVTDATKVPTMYVYKFVPSTDSTYEYVAECSNRGICERDSGLCTCFPGYTADDCHEQSSLAL